MSSPDWGNLTCRWPRWHRAALRMARSWSISGSGLARAKTMGLGAMWTASPGRGHRPPKDPRNTSAPRTAFIPLGAFLGPQILLVGVHPHGAALVDHPWSPTRSAKFLCIPKLSRNLCRQWPKLSAPFTTTRTLGQVLTGDLLQRSAKKQHQINDQSHKLVIMEAGISRLPPPRPVR